MIFIFNDYPHIVPQGRQILVPTPGQPLLLARTPTMAFVLDLPRNAAVGVRANSKNG